MKTGFKRYFCTIAFLVGFFFVAFPAISWSLTADHRSSFAFSNIPQLYFTQIQSKYRIYYGHTSHGGQIVTGLGMLAAENSSLYATPIIHEDDWTDLGDPAWPDITRTVLSHNPQVNLVIWSWCGQLSWMSAYEVDQYLAQMSRLESDYPGVIFVYMTGHLDGGGPNGMLKANNDRIRSYCSTYNKVLFDFADIESYDPTGNYFPYGSDRCEWCESWCSSQTCPACEECAHSHCFNCYQKGKAFWWMLASIEGWWPVSMAYTGPSKRYP